MQQSQSTPGYFCPIPPPETQLRPLSALGDPRATSWGSERLCHLGRSYFWRALWLLGQTPSDAMHTILQAGSGVPVRRGGRSWEEGWLSRGTWETKQNARLRRKTWPRLPSALSWTPTWNKPGWIEPAEPRSASKKFPKAVWGLLLPPGRINSIQTPALSQSMCSYSSPGLLLLVLYTRESARQTERKHSALNCTPSLLQN